MVKEPAGVTGKCAAHSQMTCFGVADFVFGVIQACLIECPLKEIYSSCQLSQRAFTIWLAVHNI